jgi:hypothetical protein
MPTRIKTSRTLRSIDGWKSKVHLARHKYIGLLAILLTATGFERAHAALVLMLIIGVSVNFAVVQFGSFVFLGFLLMELQICRMANTFLRFVSWR